MPSNYPSTSSSKPLAFPANPPPSSSNNRGEKKPHRVPIVVIPQRKRKHKNYVSRRRNQHTRWALRKIASDPVLYKSYDQWAGLNPQVGMR